jgi:hypothetical protein
LYDTQHRGVVYVPLGSWILKQEKKLLPEYCACRFGIRMAATASRYGVIDGMVRFSGRWLYRRTVRGEYSARYERQKVTRLEKNDEERNRTLSI